MASFGGVEAVAKSLVNVLNASFQAEQPVSADNPATAVLARTEDFDRDQETSNVPANGVSLFIYRVDWNRKTRPGWSSVGSVEGRSHLPLDLHFLVTPWASNSLHELRILGRTLQCLEDTPILTGPRLDSGGGWAPNEAVQVVLGELSTEDLLRIFDSLPHDYKLSVPYLARVLRLTGADDPAAGDVTTAVTGVVPSVP